MRASEVITALAMTAGRGPAARVIADSASLTSGDQVVDIGCGPGAAVREAARRGATATGIDPSPAMLWLACRISGLRRTAGVTWAEGRAEAIPLPDGCATVGWALSSFHHWRDQAAGLTEIHRVLGPGGQLLLAEWLVSAGGRGHAGHGLTHDQADRLAGQISAAGFADVRTEIRRAGRRTMVIIRGHRPAAG